MIFYLEEKKKRDQVFSTPDLLKKQKDVRICNRLLTVNHTFFQDLHVIRNAYEATSGK